MRRVLLFLLVTGMALGVGFVLLLSWLESASGRELARAQIERAISDGIAGDMQVTAIDELSLHRVKARGVTFRDPDGKPAIEVAQAVIDFTPSQLWSGPYGFSRAVIDGCHVRVTEGKDGKVNMAETFASEGKKPQGAGEDEGASKRPVDLRGMITSDCTLDIGGGSMPTLRMRELAGIMRVQVDAAGEVALRFDGYEGIFDKGLPTGVLAFRDVAGWVEPGKDKLLHFAGAGRSEGAPVTYTLDIASKPKKRVKIDATFPELSANGLRALAVAGFSAFSDTLELNVHHGK